ncbi:hypothetical protein M1N05_02120 [Dehalococcoidales bacterium]|nr:hypothetical protein [Dehalococcoidales bacterium]
MPVSALSSNISAKRLVNLYASILHTANGVSIFDIHSTTLPINILGIET